MDRGTRSRAETRKRCLRDYERCAEAVDLTLARLVDPGSRHRHDLIVCAAICRVVMIALTNEDDTVLSRLVEYSLATCRRCAELAAEHALPGGAELEAACAACLESATTLILAR